MVTMNNIPTIYQEEKQKLLDKNYNKYMNKTLKELQKDYVKAQKDIESEIAKWYAKMDDIRKANPEFRFSELKYLEDLQKQISLIIDELATVEETLLTDTLKNTYVSDYVDLNKLDMKYGLLETNTPLPEFNQLSQIQVLETYISMPEIPKAINELAKMVDVEFVGDAINGKWFSTRIMERAEKLNYSIEDKLRQAIIRGDSYNKVADVITKDLNVSYNSARTLVRTEMALAENKAVVHNAMKLGYDGLKWVTNHDSHVCDTCKKLDGTIYPVDKIKAKDLLPHPNCRCTLQEVLIDEETGKQLENPFKKEAEDYVQKKAQENRERTRKIREQYHLDKNGRKRKDKKALKNEFKQ